MTRVGPHSIFGDVNVTTACNHNVFTSKPGVLSWRPKKSRHDVAHFSLAAHEVPRYSLGPSASRFCHKGAGSVISEMLG